MVKWEICRNCDELIGQAFEVGVDNPDPVTAWMHDTWEHEGACKNPDPFPGPLNKMLVKYLEMKNGPLP